MKVLHINSVCGIRSTGRICADIAQQWIAQGNECRIAYGRLNVPQQTAPISHRIGNNASVLWHMGWAVLRDKSGHYSRRATRCFLDWIKEYDPDLIHLHNLHGFYLNLELLFDYLKSCNKPIVWSVHDCWAFTGHCPHYTSIKCEKWKDGCYDCPQIHRYPNAICDRSRKNWLEKKRWFSELPNLHLVPPSNWLKEQVQASFLGNHPISVIPNGIDCNLFFSDEQARQDLRSSYHWQHKKIILGVASVWEPTKRLADFLALAKRLDDSYRVVLIGLSKKQIRSLPQNILGITHTQNAKELAAWYNAADVFINFSAEETFGLVTAEALACGTPVIVTNSTACPEIPDVQTGICIAPQDIDGTLDAIEALLGRDQFALRRACAERARTCFDKKEMTKKYCALYESMLQ